MATKTRIGLTIYRIREIVDGVPVTAPEQVLEQSGSPEVIALKKSKNLEGKLFLPSRPTRQPSWATFLEAGFGTLPGLSGRKAPGALLVVRAPAVGSHWYAIPFGTGRFLLAHHSVVPMYGLKTALNVLYPQKKTSPKVLDTDPSRIRSVSSKSLSGRGLQTVRQSPRRALLEDFDIDTKGDLLRAVVGNPVDEQIWGKTVAGSDALHVERLTQFSELHLLLRTVEDMSARSDYKARTPWVDNISPVQDLAEVELLWDFLARHLQQSKTATLSLAPPDILPWEELRGFRVPGLIEDDSADITLEEVLGAMSAEMKKLDPQEFRRRLERMYLEALDSAGDLLRRWNLLRCVTGELTRSTKEYALFDKGFYAIGRDLLQEVNGFVGSLREAKLPLPSCGEKKAEEEYNTEAAKACNGVLLDRRTISLASRTSPVEVCDILGPQGQLIHIKKGRSSADLSHLFAQGVVSGVMLSESRDFHDKARELLKVANGGKYPPESALPIYPSSEFSREVCFGVIKKWGQKTFVDGTPFFSRLNLMNQARELQRRGLNVSYQRLRYG